MKMKRASHLLTLAAVGVLVSSLLAAGCSILAPLFEAEIPWPTEGWPISTPEEQGMDSAPLEQMMEIIDENDVPIDSVLVIRHGFLVFEQYRNGYDEISSHHLQSVTKSFTSTLIGIALQQGFLESVDQRVLDFYPDRELENPDPRKEQITLEHLLTMSPGMDWIELQVPYTDPSNSLGRMWRSRDVIQHVLDHPMLRDPGEAWGYNSGTSILLGDIVEQASGIDTLVFARQFLFDPLGFGATYWQETNDGRHYHTDGGLFMTPRDMARLGYLMLHDGVWEGERLLPEGWVEQATTAQYESYPGHGYAYQWWTIEGTDIFYASGHYDQAIFIIPEADMVVVFTANVPDEAIHPLEGFLFRYILGSCTDLPEGLLQGEISDYGFRFEYGLDFVPGILPFPGTEAVTPQAGAIQFSFINYPIEIFTVMWYEAFKGMEPEEALATASELLQHQPGLNSTWKESAELQIEDQEIALEVLDVETEGIFFTAFIGVWTCENAEQPFVLTFATDASGPVESQLVRLRELLGSFSCAPSE